MELSGEMPDMALEEVLAVGQACGSSSRLLEKDEGMAIVETDASPESMATRLALCWNVSEYLFSFMDMEIDDKFGALDLGGKTFAIRVKRTHEVWRSEDSQHLINRIGQVVGKTGKVDLDSPELTLRIVMGKRIHAGWLSREIDRTSFEKRKGKDRPFSHPISLHPRYARALVNLTRVRTGEKLLDPFCGTGGILIEAGLVGAEIMGSDIDARMIDGCKINLEHFLGKDAEFGLHEMDVANIQELGEVDAIATDPPYGRSASTAKEDIEELYTRAFKAFSDVLKPGGRLAIVLPEKKYSEIGERYFTLASTYELFVHRSLTRHFCLFEKNEP